ncbi:polysaccharide ABC transporter ATP-binding protein [Leptolyngbya sp. DQ-M1]|uniref:ABC transporter ATP-binding protein n=1 Tax=Leptolyngbya sp. DQ-M1 TaxID=2933920 RepID=UPI0032994DCB
MAVTHSIVPESIPSTSQEVILSVNGVSKKFCRDLKRSLFYGIHDISSELAGRRRSRTSLRSHEFWALHDISFELRRGEALGLVGKNGSGKSTLLRIISGLIRPDQGQVEVRGRVAPLIALGAGFNPILTGRENIYANMSILGLSKPQIDRVFDQVLEFAEINDAIDSPVQSYSSGMAARLGFACAIHTEPDILLLDEVLAVGDLRFRAKCYRRLAELRDRGVAFILVSHSSNTILSKCDTALYLSKGQLILSGDAAVVTRRYENELFLEGAPPATGELQRPQRATHESSGLDITGVFFRDRNATKITTPISGEKLDLCIQSEARHSIAETNMVVSIRERAGEGDKVLVLSTLHDKTPIRVTAGANEIRVEFPYLGLKPGSYLLDLHLYQGNYILLDSIKEFSFAVEGTGSMSECSFYQPRCWTAVQTEAE